MLLVHLLLRLFYLLPLLFTIGCASRSQLLLDSDYTDSVRELKLGNLENSINQFPNHKEKDGFITTTEKSWLHLWNPLSENIELEQKSKSIDERKIISISREAEHFFLSETEEGYIPGEHEIIILHLIAAMQFIKEKKWEPAKVEARRAAFYLQSYIPETETHFDDPSLRLWLASIWIALGQWEEAQVDFRKIRELNPLVPLPTWINKKEAPQNITLVFDGVGPELIWSQSSSEPVFQNGMKNPELQISYETTNWSVRHLQRNSTIRQFIEKSNYMTEYYGIEASAYAKEGTGQFAGNAIKLTGYLTGATIVIGGFYLAASAHISQGVEPIFYLGALVGTAIIGVGDKVIQDFNKSANMDRREGYAQLKNYRFIRYLPNWISVTNEPLNETASEASIRIENPESKTIVIFLNRF